MQFTADAFIERGDLTPPEVQTYVDALQDPDFCFVEHSMIAAWGQALPTG